MESGYLGEGQESGSAFERLIAEEEKRKKRNLIPPIIDPREQKPPTTPPDGALVGPSSAFAAMIEEQKLREGLTTQAPAEQAAAAQAIGVTPWASENFDNIMRMSSQFLGTPYVWGGNTKKGIDCSGFTCQVYKEAGVNLPRTAREQAKKGTEVGWKDMKPGDAIYFDMKANGDVTHTGIYMGNGKMRHASASKGVVEVPLTDYWKGKAVTVRRFTGKPVVEQTSKQMDPKTNDIIRMRDIDEEIAGHEARLAALPTGKKGDPETPASNRERLKLHKDIDRLKKARARIPHREADERMVAAAQKGGFEGLGREFLKINKEVAAADYKELTREAPTIRTGADVRQALAGQVARKEKLSLQYQKTGDPKLRDEIADVDADMSRLRGKMVTRADLAAPLPPLETYEQLQVWTKRENNIRDWIGNRMEARAGEKDPARKAKLSQEIKEWQKILRNMSSMMSPEARKASSMPVPPHVQKEMQADIDLERGQMPGGNSTNPLVRSANAFLSGAIYGPASAAAGIGEQLGLVDEKTARAFGTLGEASMPKNATFGEKIVAGLGSVASSAVPALAVGSALNKLAMAGKAAKWAQATVFGIEESVVNGGQTYQNLRSQGMSVGEAGSVATAQMMAEAVPNILAARFSIFGEGKGFVGMVKRAAPESLQEGYQQAMQNIAMGRPWDEGIGEAALIGGVVGLIIAGAGTANQFGSDKIAQRKYDEFQKMQVRAALMSVAQEVQGKQVQELSPEQSARPTLEPTAPFTERFGSKMPTEAEIQSMRDDAKAKRKKKSPVVDPAPAEATKTTPDLLPDPGSVEAAPLPTGAVEGKPWEMTREEHRRHKAYTGMNSREQDIRMIDASHRSFVVAALEGGQHVPAEVLADYPDLVPASPTPAVPKVAPKPKAAKPAAAEKLPKISAKPAPKIEAAPSTAVPDLPSTLKTLREEAVEKADLVYSTVGFNGRNPAQPGKVWNRSPIETTVSLFKSGWKFQPANPDKRIPAMMVKGDQTWKFEFDDSHAAKKFANWFQGKMQEAGKIDGANKTEMVQNLVGALSDIEAQAAQSRRERTKGEPGEPSVPRQQAGSELKGVGRKSMNRNKQRGAAFNIFSRRKRRLDPGDAPISAVQHPELADKLYSILSDPAVQKAVANVQSVTDNNPSAVVEEIRGMAQAIPEISKLDKREIAAVVQAAMDAGHIDPNVSRGGQQAWENYFGKSIRKLRPDARVQTPQTLIGSKPATATETGPARRFEDKERADKGKEPTKRKRRDAEELFAGVTDAEVQEIMFAIQEQRLGKDMTPEQIAAAQRYKVRVLNEIDAIESRIANAPQQATKLWTMLEVYEAQLDILSEALQGVRTNWSEVGEALQTASTREYDFISLKQRGRAKNVGVALDEKTTGKLKETADRYRKAQNAKNAALEEARNEFIETAKTIKTDPEGAKAMRLGALGTLKKLGLRVIEAGKAVGARIRGKQAGAVLIPEGEGTKMTNAINKLVRSYVMSGEVQTLDQAVKKLMEDIPDLDIDQAIGFIAGKYRDAHLEVDIAKRDADAILRKIREDAEVRVMNSLEKAGHAILDIMNAARQLKASFDLSAPFFQGVPTLLGAPTTWVKSIGQMVKVVKGGEPAYTKYLAELRNSPVFKRAIAAGVEFTDAFGKRSEKEELFRSRLVEWLKSNPATKVFGREVERSEFAYTVFLNTARLDLFRKMYVNEGPFTKAFRLLGIDMDSDAVRIQFQKDIANHVNVMTGRGVGEFSNEIANKAMSAIFFAPRYNVAIWQNAFGSVATSRAASGKGRAAVLDMYAKQVVGLAASIAAFWMLGLRYDKDEPLDGLIVAPDGRRVPFFRKVLEPLRLVQDVKDAEGEQGKIIVTRYLENKLSPLTGVAWNAFVSKGKFNPETGEKEPVTAATAAWAFVPISLERLAGKAIRHDKITIGDLIGAATGIDVWEKRTMETSLPGLKPPGLKPSTQSIKPKL